MGWALLTAWMQASKSSRSEGPMPQMPCNALGRHASTWSGPRDSCKREKDRPASGAAAVRRHDGIYACMCVYPLVVCVGFQHFKHARHLESRHTIREELQWCTKQAAGTSSYNTVAPVASKRNYNYTLADESVNACCPYKT